MLTVRGERRPPWESLEGCTARVERSFGAFERTLRVTDGLDPEGIEASMSDGVLMMRLPEPAQTQPRRIQIRPSTATGNGAGMQAEAEGGAGDSAPATGRDA
jgi:HSP20 family protein